MAARAPESFVNVSFDDQPGDFYEQWIAHNGGKSSNGMLISRDTLRKLHPDHTIVSTQDIGRLSLLDFPGVSVEPANDTPLLTDVIFVPLPSSTYSVPGMLFESVNFGKFNATWQDYEFILYILTIPQGMFTVTQTYILRKGSEEPARDLLLTVGLWSQRLHNEIWVFNQGYWSKDADLWRDVQKADWADVILDDTFKKALQKDVYGFFQSEKLYKDLGIPWKRGLIMHGPPGNGKTISLKAIMKSCDALGFNPLYVKSFAGWGGEEASMANVFNKARQVAPCVVILEDLDALINDNNRSFFLNQMDGLQGNDGLLVIATTNHFDRLDPGLSTRPSRFDRKFLFDDPKREERALYAVYWQNKLKGNKEIDYPDSLVDKIAGATDKFSFAYLKEAYVSSLVLLAGIEGEKPTFKSVILDQITVLRQQLDKSSGSSARGALPPPPPPPGLPMKERNFTAGEVTKANAANDFRSLLDRLSSRPVEETSSGTKRTFMPGGMDSVDHIREERSEFRNLLNRLSINDASEPTRRQFTAGGQHFMS